MAGLTNTQFATLVTTGLPLLDPSTRILVRFGASVIVPSGLPNTLAGIAAATNADGSVNISVPLPSEGAGTGIPIALLCMRGNALVSSSPTAGVGAGTFSYEDPSISGVAVTRPLFNGSCPFPASAASAGWSCTNAALLLVSVTGANFGANDAAPGFVSDGVVKSINLTYSPDPSSNASAWAVSSGPGAATAFSSGIAPSGPVLWRSSWGHTRVQFYTTAPAASVILSLVSTSGGGSSGGAMSMTSVQSASGAYTRVSPSITSLNGPTTGIPSTGGAATAPLYVTAVGVTAAYYASVLIGGSYDCPLLSMTNGVCSTTLVNASVGASGVAPYTNLPDAVHALVMSVGAQGAAAAASGTLTLCCVPPPGQGASLSVQIQLYSSGSDSAPQQSDAGAAGVVVSRWHARPHTL